jgi:hypothetical protein
MRAMQIALVLVCALSAVTAIVALSFTDQARRTLHRTADDAALVETVQLRLERVAAAGGRVLLTGSGLEQVTDATRALDVARARLHGLDGDRGFVAEVEAFDRDVGDFQATVDQGARTQVEDRIRAFVAYRDGLKSVRDAVQADAAELVRALSARSDASSDRSATVATRARSSGSTAARGPRPRPQTARPPHVRTYSTSRPSCAPRSTSSARPRASGSRRRTRGPRMTSRMPPRSSASSSTACSRSPRSKRARPR